MWFENNCENNYLRDSRRKKKKLQLNCVSEKDTFPSNGQFRIF